MKIISISILMVLGLLFAMASTILISSQVAHAQNLKDSACDGIQFAGGGTGCGAPGDGDNDVSTVITAVINVLSLIAGTAAVIVIIVGGFRYIVSGGDSSGVAGAKNSIIYAIVGLVVVIFAQAIVRFVIGKV